MFGKPGRPPEDRLQRRREIWAAVSPLIQKVGARNLTMRQAAAASFMSLGGLYHYFPNKRSLVLYGMDQEAAEHSCAEFKRRYSHLAQSDPNAVVEGFIHHFAGEASFIQPAVQAALQLGADEFLPRLESNLNMGLEGFMQTLSLALPDATETALHGLARAMRRLFFASLVDTSVSPEEIEAELRALVRGMAAPQRQPVAAGAA
jgi:AcrR family transcriptional regulator